MWINNKPEVVDRLLPILFVMLLQYSLGRRYEFVRHLSVRLTPLDYRSLGWSHGPLSVNSPLSLSRRFVLAGLRVDGSQDETKTWSSSELAIKPLTHSD